MTFHGALDRTKYTIPRFERARQTEQLGTSCLYWADPSLWLDEKLALSWFTGAGSLDLFELLADRSVAVAEAIGANRVIFTGSSGGGFASLQVSARVPHSAALVFNPQTTVFHYWQSVQRPYIRVCFPNLLPVPAEDFDFSYDWTEALGDRLSAVRRYAKPTENTVHYWTNTHDWHHKKHFQPFKRVLGGSASETLTVHPYDGGKGHHPPSSERFAEALQTCLDETSSFPI
ncbi:hypothetical protein [Nesterenkonia ebinurensis]|uniref:hypothetical protein n=1 Tax=Nesterenkonia ebinurensis TaxID=2608252 RepID=UPI00123CA5A2|nr:hypothetical protein [Nesterenkonia ebinurensis]